MTRDTEHTPSPQSVAVPVEPTELVNKLVQELAPDQGQSASIAFGLALELQGAIAVPPCSAALRADLNNYVTRCIRSTPEADMSLEEALIARAARALSAPGEATWAALDENGSAELRVNGKRITTFPSYGGAEEAANRINAALSPEAPARDGEPMLRVVPDTSVEGCYRLEDALTPRHEAPASEDEARRKLINCIDQWDSEMEYDAEDRASLADDILHAFNGPPVVSHEAPAEEAGEITPTDHKSIGKALYARREGNRSTEGAVLRLAAAGFRIVRARSSAPEACLTVIDPDQWESCSPDWLKRHPADCGKAPRVWCEAESNHYHPVNWPTAAPSADKLRVLSLEFALCLALDVLGQHEPTDARAVSDEYVAMAAVSCNVSGNGCEEIILAALEERGNPNAARFRQALAALKAEG